MILDIIVAIVLAFGFYTGYNRGLIRTIFDTASLLVGIIAALKLSPIAINLVDSVLSTKPAISFIIGIVLTFVVVMIVVRFIGKKLEDLFKAINLNFVNQLAGGVIQSLFFALLISLGLYLLDNLKLLQESTKEESMSYSMLEPLPRKSQAVFTKLKPMFQGFWDKTVETMDEIKEKAEKKENQEQSN